ncbi:chew domain protein [Mesorhizobium sp. LSJC268A00]|uniref:chemotaxis protein CheW n=1 Tax=unclassified Mesorhizobium TaxID=325217 RepID=UPI0003CECE4E|nr:MULTISPECIES: chemotaxis protein CheW [unclassified Mesorhizobium]ESW69017.1 chew domain protein [Mesorhizobium sp. LSJC277A00]ESW83791.1 chew domain protein [Mesorhizobium sp. LSJC285A00]ESX01626.1 chew domain protein [Mesorhizobium sp. LSJC268A00]ESZ12057.1 chew domain protein [Mesorhizobium sp. L2C085B000]ESZ36340.1 chew domain protein [Mesorhizobium sp. L2C066B000]
MLFLAFSMGPDRYLIDVHKIEEVLPYIDVKVLPGAPTGVVGLVSYNGIPIPLIDVTLLALGRPSERLLSTRIVVTRYPADDGERRLLGLIAERVTDTIERDPADFAPFGLEPGTPPYLGPVASDGSEIIQWVKVEALLSEEIRTALLRQAAIGDQ